MRFWGKSSKVLLMLAGHPLPNDLGKIPDHAPNP